MESIFSRYKNALVLMLVLLAQVVLLAMQVRRPVPGMPEGHNVRLWRSLVAGVVTPPERLAHNVGLSVRGVWSNYIDLRNLREENQKLEDENDRLRLDQASLAEDAREAQRLREVLDFRGKYIDTTLPAQVIGTSGTDQARTLYIDRGLKDGLQTQMPVITPDGVVGKVKNVFAHTSQVLLISDQTSGTGVMLQTTRIRGVMKGNASGQPQIINISPDERIEPGEPVVTSGGDQVYPPGLPVGVVERVVADPDTPYVSIVVKPNANLAQLEEVMVVTQISDKMPFPEEKDMMQSEVDALALKQRASDVLSEKLPSLHELNAPDTASSDSSETDTAAAGSDPARPIRPPQALHPDRFTPGNSPPAGSLVPGEAPPIAHRAQSTDTNASTTVQAVKPATGGGQGAVSNGVAIPSRFPTRPAAPAISKSASGLTLPLQPADPTAIDRPATSAGASVVSATGKVSAGTVAGTVPRTATSGSSSATAPRSAASGLTTTTVPRATTPGSPATATPRAATSSAATGATLTPSTGTSPHPTATTGGAATASSRPATKPASAGSATPAIGTAPASRRIQLPSDSGSGGILTPAGMGSLGVTPRPRPTTPAGTGAGDSPASPKGPAGQTVPATKPRPSAAPLPPPPGGR